jgi:hypothetical protein
MSSKSYHPSAEEDCWTERNALVKEEREEEAVTVKQEVKDEAVTVKDVSVKEEGEDKQEGAVFTVKEETTVTVKEEEDVFGVKEDAEITVTLDEEQNGDLINTSE